MFSKSVKSLVLVLLVGAMLNVSASTFDFTLTTRDKKKFHILVTYEVDKAYTGNEYFPLDISIDSKDSAGGDLTLKDCKPPDGAKLDTRVETVDATHYRCMVRITNEADPRIYRIEFTFMYPEQSLSSSFLLPVGVRTNKDTDGNDRVRIRPKASPIEFLASNRNEFPFDIRNSFPDYPVVIQSVTITASRPELVRNVDVSSLNPPANQIEPLQTNHALARFDIAGMSLRDLLLGFPEKTNLIVDVTYTDGYGRKISDMRQEFPIMLRPRDRVLYLAIVIGVLAGAVIKLYLQRLQSQGVITRKEAVRAVAITVFIGLVVSVIALAGQIKITAFELTGSYDKPFIIFIIGLTGALVGAQLLTSWFKRLTNKSE